MSGDTKPRAASTDVILAHSILHLVEDVPRTLRQLHRMLKPGGLLISNTQCIGDECRMARLGRASGSQVGAAAARQTYFASLSSFQWLNDSGFDFEEVWQPKPKASHYLVAKAVDV